MLISVPPSSLADAEQQTRFFIWPLWARYHDRLEADDGLLGTIIPGYGYMGQGSGAMSDSTIIWDFTGRRFLEQDTITMQSRLSTSGGFNLSVPAGEAKLIYGFNVPESVKAGAANSSEGLWNPYQYITLAPLPMTPPLIPYNEFFGMVPQTYSGTLRPLNRQQPEYLFNSQFDKDEFTANGQLEFFYQLSDSTRLLAGRLDVNPGTNPALVPDWYRRVRPFSFGLHGITRQRSGVTILNNVINSDKRENVFLDYRLLKSGRVTIQVFTLDGTLVKVLKSENQPASGERYYRVAWDGTNRSGRPVARGMYFIRIVAPDIDEIRKVMVVR